MREKTKKQKSSRQTDKTGYKKHETSVHEQVPVWGSGPRAQIGNSNKGRAFVVHPIRLVSCCQICLMKMRLQVFSIVDVVNEQELQSSHACLVDGVSSRTQDGRSPRCLDEQCPLAYQKPATKLTVDVLKDQNT